MHTCKIFSAFGVLSAFILIPALPSYGLETHSPITISGNGGFTSGNGVSNPGAAGTAENPYIIENWSIDAGGGTGIEIKNTSKHFVLRNCLVENGNKGIILDNVTNGTVDNTTSRKNSRAGIFLKDSNNNVISNGTYSNNHSNSIGLWLEGSDNNLVTGNTCHDNSHYGIFLWNSSEYNTISKNSCEGNHQGLYLRYASHYNMVTKNNCSNNTRAGILLANGPHDNTITHNVTDNNTGVNVSSSAGIWLWENVSNNTFSHNITRYNSGGGGSGGITMSANGNNHSDSNVFFRNLIVENESHGLCVGGSGDTSGTNSTIYNNVFINNSNQATANGLNDWDDGYPTGGNYWSDYSGVDNYSGPDQDIPGSDGIGDTPYNIGGNYDNYPLMEIPHWDIADGGAHVLDCMIFGGVRIDYGSAGTGTTVNIVDGCDVIRAFAGDSAELVLCEDSGAKLYGGQIGDKLIACDRTTVFIEGGTTDAIDAQDTSEIRILGGGYNYPIGHVSDTSGTLTGTLLSGDALNVSFDRASGASIILMMPGDVDIDGTVGTKDLAVILQNYGQLASQWEMGDLVDDDVVTTDDLAAVLQNWGLTGEVSTGATNIPEPASGALLAMAGLALIGKKRR